jgi:hypothetical protein
VREWRRFFDGKKAGNSATAFPREEEHEEAEEQKEESPPEVHVEAKGALVELGIAPGDETKPCEQESEQGEEEADGEAEVEVHGRIRVRVTRRGC